MQSIKIPQNTLGTEAIRAFFTLQCCWLNNEEVYLEQGCLHCGSAATYLIFYTNRYIQHIMLSFIQRYRCANRFDVRDLDDFEQDYEKFLQKLEYEVNLYARSVQHEVSTMCFEQVDSIFEHPADIAC